MIANARMYAVSSEAAALWRTLLTAVIARTPYPITVIDHPSPRPLEQLWARTDLGAVFMCGLPFSRASPQPALIAAPVPSPPEFGGEPRYWSEFVVQVDSRFHTVTDTFGSRIAFTVPESQSGCVAAMTYLMAPDGNPTPAQATPLFRELVAPTITPLGALNAVVTGAAEIAPIDAYALRLLQRFRPELTSQVRVVGRTAVTPIPPLVASSPDLRQLPPAFLAAADDPAAAAPLRALLLRRFSQPPPASYDTLRNGLESARSFWRTRRLAAATHPAFAPFFR